MAFTPFKVKVVRWETQTTLDLTERLEAGGRVQVTDEQERGAFERVAGDLRLEVGDQDGVARAFLFVDDQTIKFVVDVWVYDSTLADTSEPYVRRWRGDIDVESIVYDQKTEMLKFDAFSMIKSFWDKAKLSRIAFPRRTLIKPDPNNQPANWWDYPYVNFNALLALELNPMRSSERGRLFMSFDAGTLGTTRQIRSVQSNPGYGDEGRFSALNVKTTVEELLKACALEYNAIVHLDPATATLMITPRATLPTTFVDVEPDLINDPIEINVTDGLKYDWLLSYRRVKGPAPIAGEWTPTTLQGDSLFRYQLKGKKYYSYRVVGLYQGTPRAEGDILEVLSPQVPPGSWTGFESFQLILPAFPEGFTGRDVYRKVSGAFMKVASSTNNNEGDAVLDKSQGDQLMLERWNDSANDYAWRKLLQYPEGVTSAFDVYHGYTEAEGWSQAVTDFLNEGKEGKIFDVRPQLNFVDAAGHDLPGLDYLWVQSFFGKEYLDTDEFFRQNFADMFRLRRGAKLSVRGLNWYVGQGVRLKWLPNDTTPVNDYVVKKVTLDLIEEQATLEVYSI